MNLPSDLLSEFVKVTNDNTKTKDESTVYGTTVTYNGETYVKLDGSELLTPVVTTAAVSDGERVTVMIKNHTATITGNVSAPSAKDDDVTSLGSKISEHDILIANRATIAALDVERARIDELESERIEVDEIVADNVTIKERLTAAEGEIDTLQADNVTITDRLTAAEADIKELVVGSLDVSVLDAKYAKVEDLEATNTDVHNLEATYADFEVANANKFTAVDASIEELQANKLSATDADIVYAKISDLDATNANVDILESDVADIDTLIFGSASGSTIQTSFANAVIAQLGNAQIKSAMIDSVTASKITAGDIITNKVRVLSEDGRLLISDETLQISDTTRIRVQIGKDSVNDYSINVWDTDGNLMFSKGGITDSAIKDAIIRNDMVSDTANISAHKLDIDSLFKEINGSSNTIKSTQVYLDDEKQTLNLAFKELTTEVTDLGTTVSSQGTQITAIQGQISSKIWKQDINTATAEMSTQYSTLEQEVDNIFSTVSETYATKAEVAAIDIGGRNLIANTDATTIYSGNVNDNVGGTYKDIWSSKLIDIPTGTEYVVSFDAKADVAQDISCFFHRLEGNNTLTSESSTGQTSASLDGNCRVTIATEWDRYWVKWTQTPSDAMKHVIVGRNHSENDVYIRAVKFESGNKPTDWTPAPEDIDLRMETAETQIEQNTEAITLRATKTELESVQDNLANNYYDKTATEAQIAVASDNITSSVSETYATKTELATTDTKAVNAGTAAQNAQDDIDALTVTVQSVYATKSEVEQTASSIASTVSSTYATKTEVNDISVGARNLLLNTGGNELPVMSNGGSVSASSAVSASNSEGVLTLNYSSTGTTEIYYRFMNPAYSYNNMHGLEPGKSYTFSGKVKMDTTSGTLDRFAVRVQNYTANSGWWNVVNTTILSEDTDEWVEFAVTFTNGLAAEGCFVSLQLYFADSWVGTVQLTHLQLEKGTLASDWAPAPEDYPTVESVSNAQASADAAQASVDNLELGGRNLLLNSKAFKGSNVLVAASIDSETHKDFAIRVYDATSLTKSYEDIVTFSDIYVDKLGATYTLSFYAKGAADSRLCTYFYGAADYLRVATSLQSTGVSGTAADGATYWSLTEDWQRYWVTWTLRDTGDISVEKYVMFRLWAGGSAYICGCKLEKGDKATDWTPAPEDVDSDIATAQAAAEAAQATANQNAEDMANIVTNFNSDISNLQTQIDGSITTWFYEIAPTESNEPAVNWTTTDLKNVHLGDLYYDTITGYCYRYQVQNNIYSWQRITDTDVTKALADAQTAQDTADQKRRVFYVQPTSPYDPGDLWVQGSTGDILRCQTAKVSGQSYSSSDWVAASKYTDDTVANSAVQKANAAQQAAEAAQNDIDNLIIGARNLIPNSKGDDVTGWVYAGDAIVEDEVKGHCLELQNSTLKEKYFGTPRTCIVEQSTEYTLSLDMWCNEYLKNYDLFWLSDTYDDPKTTGGYVNIIVKSLQKLTPNMWTRVVWTFTTNADDRTGYIRIDNNLTTEEGTAAILRIANLKLEKGNRATDWTPAPEDFDERVTTAETKILQNSESITSLATRTTTVENKFTNYSTTEEMNSAISQSATSITSTVSETYTTKTEFSDLEIGGRNLVAGTDDVTEYVGNITDGTLSYRDVWSAKTIDIPTGDEYIVSFDAKSDIEQNISCYFYSPNTTLTSVSSTGQSRTGGDGVCQVTITTEWARYWVKWTQTAATTTKSIIVGRNFSESDVYIRAVKFEAGNKATDWSPAPEDMATEKDLTSVQTSLDSTSERIAEAESLIQQLSDSIMTIVTDENGESLMVQTDTGWTFSTTQIQGTVDSLSENLDGLLNEMGDVNATVSSLQQAVDDLGVLNDYVKITTYEDEPCIELGESDSDFKLMITNTRIMFMEGSSVPAYINNQSLYIKKAVIEEELQQGEFVWKARANGNLGLIWKGVTS